MRYELDLCWCPCHGGVPAARSDRDGARCELCETLHLPRRSPAKPFLPPGYMPYRPDDTPIKGEGD